MWNILPYNNLMGVTVSQVQLRGNAEDIAAYRNMFLGRQNGLCAICCDPIEMKPKSVHLDHDHKKS